MMAMKKGKYVLKIRANNSEDFDNKVKQINNQINTMGMTIKTTKNETHRPITDVVITTNWDDTNLAKNVKNRIKTPGPKPKEEKKSNWKIFKC